MSYLKTTAFVIHEGGKRRLVTLGFELPRIPVKWEKVFYWDNWYYVDIVAFDIDNRTTYIHLYPSAAP